MSQQNKLYCLQHCSNIMTIDDHDIIDDFGQITNIPLFTSKWIATTADLSKTSIQKLHLHYMKLAYLQV